MSIHPPCCIFPFFTPLFAFHSAVVILAIKKIMLFGGKKEACFPTKAWNLNELSWRAGDKVLRYSSLFTHMLEISFYCCVSEAILSQLHFTELIAVLVHCYRNPCSPIIGER